MVLWSRPTSNVNSHRRRHWEEAVMLRMPWHFLSSFLPRAGCQGPREGNHDEVRGTPAPAGEDQMSSSLGKPAGRAEAPEKRPTILLVVGPAEQFPQVMTTSRGPPTWGWPRIESFSWRKLKCGEEENLKVNLFGFGAGEKRQTMKTAQIFSHLSVPL